MTTASTQAFYANRKYSANAVSHKVILLDSLPKKVAEFYRQLNNVGSQSERFFQEARRYADRHFCKSIIIFDCMDERQDDTRKNLGIPALGAVSVRTAGNQLGDYNRHVEAEIMDIVKDSNKEASGDRLWHPVLILFVTHSSKSRPHDDSCAAWKHETAAALKDAELQVQRFNHGYAVFDSDGNVKQRFAIALHLHTYTDTEAIAFIGEESRVDPSIFADASIDSVLHDLNGIELENMAYKLMRQTFPFEDPRFLGLKHEDWEKVLHQLAEMLVANAHVVRAIADKRREASKAGHQGNFIVVGRGWELLEEANTHFSIGDYAYDISREARIAGKYVLVNAIRSVAQGQSNTCSVPFHINVPYGDDTHLKSELDRCASARYALGLARRMLNYWRKIAKDKAKRAAFQQEVWQALEHAGAGQAEKAVLDNLFQPGNFMRLFQFYVSVSHKRERQFELIATTQEVANS